MTLNTDLWELRHGDELIGRLTIFDQDMFWYSALFDPMPEYAAYRPIFEEGNIIRTQDDADAFDAWYEKVRQLGLRLVRLRDQATADEFILYIDGNEAEFRPYFDS